MIVILPTIFFGSINLIIFKYVRNSTRRIQANTINTVTDGGRILSKRDVKLLKNMLIMFLLFTLGWAPIYIFRLIGPTTSIVGLRIMFGLVLLPVNSLVINMIILYYKNKDLLIYICQRVELQAMVVAPQRPTIYSNRNGITTVNI